ncbi:stage II sporulation protein M [Seinonella peptonophila]|uniref:Stage II sporulation protein M n=1 Tax=Seinonella peptonophila TaxID=112248 RepID=A0A1M4TK80_9BACL|nr:stage II sporulation protein M [Seinonella peptonophila]SHE44912.1 stage II sporulation protein M [Seinonella peptonophila]
MRSRKKQWNQTLHHHFQTQKSLYLFVTVLLMMGVIFGAVLVNVLDGTQKEGLLNYLGYFFQGLRQNEIADPEIMFQHAIGDHLKTVGIMWILGISIIGMPVILILIFLKGLVVGFTVGFLVHQLSWKGFWFAFVSVVPQNLFIIPAMIIIAVLGLHFSITLVRNRLIKHRGRIYPQFVSYSLVVTMLVGSLLVAAGMEAYLSPWLMKQTVPEVGMQALKLL